MRDLTDPEYLQRLGQHLVKNARALGWDPSGAEGAYEHVTRMCWQRGVEDCVDNHYLALSHRAEYLLTKLNKE